MKYHVVTGIIGVNDFEEQVSKLLDKGWELHGQTQSLIVKDNILFFQAMIKTDAPETPVITAEEFAVGLKRLSESSSKSKQAIDELADSASDVGVPYAEINKMLIHVAGFDSRCSICNIVLPGTHRSKSVGAGQRVRVYNDKSYIVYVQNDKDVYCSDPSNNLDL